MKKRDIFLDFTSLLDVTLIVIFFFVLFSHFESQENKAKTEAEVSKLRQEQQEAEARKESAKELNELLEQELSIVRESNDRQASNIQEIIDFRKGKNLKFVMDFGDEGWSLKVVSDEEIIATAYADEEMFYEIENALKNAGYEEDETIFCDFVYDGSKKGSTKAYEKVYGVIKDLSSDYSFLYVSETDISLGEVE